MTSATNAEPMKFFEVSKFINYWYLAGAAQRVARGQPEGVGRAPEGPPAGRARRAEGRPASRTRSGRTRPPADERARKRLRRARHDGGRSAPRTRSRRRARPPRAGWDTWLTRTGADGKRGHGPRPEGPRPVIGARGERGGAPRGLRHARHRAARSRTTSRMRYFFDRPQLFVDEVASFLQVLVIFGGAAYTFRAGGHVRVDLVTGAPAPAGAGVAARGAPSSSASSSSASSSGSPPSPRSPRTATARVSAVMLYPLWLPMLPDPGRARADGAWPCWPRSAVRSKPRSVPAGRPRRGGAGRPRG